MKITKEQKQYLGAGLFWIGVAVMVYGLGQMSGYLRGYRRAVEDQKQIQCQLDYGYKPQSEISGNCLKYFKVK